MPIKLPKGFPLRRSSGNALEELPNPPEPSFRVFERPEGSKSFDGGNNLKRRSYGRPLSAGQSGQDHLFVDGRPNVNSNNRGSGGTNNSTSSGGHGDNSSMSARYSSTSTLPSSTDVPLDENSYSAAKRSYDIPAPPVPESHQKLKAAGRAFSFGRKKAEASRLQVEQAQSESRGFNRPRAMTESSYASESTATPPKFLEGGLDFDDGFGSMFETFGKRPSSVLEQPPTLGGAKTESPENMSPAGSRMLTKSYFGERQLTPSPINLDKSPATQDSPRSWASDDSQEGLMSTGRRRAADALAYSNNTSSGPTSGNGTGLSLSKSITMPVTEPSSPPNRRKQQRPPPVPGDGLKGSSGYASQKNPARNSDRLQDEDAKLIMSSLSASQRLNRLSKTALYDDEPYNPAASLIQNSSQPSSPYVVSDHQKGVQPKARQRSPAPLFDSNDQDFSATSSRQHSTQTTPRAKKSAVVQEERSLFDVSPSPTGRSAPTPLPRAQPPPKPDTKNKIMTPAQFEKYRKEQEIRRDQYANKEESDEEGDDYEDDDEMERNKQLARERRKQEAHLSVYRQQMMKVTGEQPSDLPARSGLDRASQSAPNLANRSETPTFSFDKPTEVGRTSDDEDEDVPLGVLAAHGFPSKIRPPTAGSSHIRYKSESYPPPPASTTGASTTGGPRPLPPFAKNLPQDPYYGASLVNPPNRESLAFGQNGPPSVAGSSRPNMAPGGLVGVIAGEERARAARRGSPNAQGKYGSPLPPSMQMGMPPGMPPMMSPGEQATVHMSEQMTQMMQMQMQWMQQMQNMMAGGIQPQQPPFMMPPQQPGMLAPRGQAQRPISAPGTPAGLQPAQQRTMSMMGPSTAPSWQPHGNARMSQAPSMMSGALGGHGPGYAPSLAPSERSNVGMPTRYRPVSIAPTDEHVPRPSSRATTLTAGALQPGTSGRNSRMSTSGDRQSKLSLRPVTAAKKTASDDDDDEGWEQMKQQREKKKSTWRLKKHKDEHRGLDLYDYPEQ